MRQRQPTRPQTGSLLEARLLGGCDLRYQGRHVPAFAFKRRRSLTLLLWLLTIPEHRAPRTQALAVLWPEKHPEESESGLRVVLADLRAGLGERVVYSPVMGQGQLIALTPDLELVVDADTFESAATAA